MELPEETTIEEIREPWVQIDVLRPTEFIGQVMDMVTEAPGKFKAQEYLDQRRVMLSYHIPLVEILTEFYNELKARTRGYASLDYHFEDYRAGRHGAAGRSGEQGPRGRAEHDRAPRADLREGHAAGQQAQGSDPAPAVRRADPGGRGRKVVSRANVKAVRKDVLAKCYGGDITRKRKLLEKQKAGKKRMKMIGSVEIPQEAFMTILKLDEE